MVKINVSSSDINELMKWKDNHKDRVRSGDIAFTDVEIICDDLLKIRVKKMYKRDGYDTYGFELSDVISNHIMGRFVIKLYYDKTGPSLFAVEKGNPELGTGETQDSLTLWASIQAYVIDYQPKEIEVEKAKSAANKNKKKRNKKQSNDVHIIKIKDIVYINKMESKLNQNESHRAYTKPDFAFSIRGHIRHYKNGKTVYIHPYMKNVNKDDVPSDKLLKIDFRNNHE